MGKLRLPGAVSPDMLHFASLRITLTVPEVVGTENLFTSNLPFLIDPSSIAKMLEHTIAFSCAQLSAHASATEHRSGGGGGA